MGAVSNGWLYTRGRKIVTDYVISYIVINITTTLIIYCNWFSHKYYLNSDRKQIDNVIPMLKYHNAEYLNRATVSNTITMARHNPAQHSKSGAPFPVYDCILLLVAIAFVATAISTWGSSYNNRIPRRFLEGYRIVNCLFLWFCRIALQWYTQMAHLVESYQWQRNFHIKVFVAYFILGLICINLICLLCHFLHKT